MQRSVTTVLPSAPDSTLQIPLELNVRHQCAQIARMWYIRLAHIGPADSRDIPSLCECLTLKNEEALILTAKSLTLIGITGRSAADSLEAATRTTIDRYLKLQQTFGSELYDERDNSGRVFVAAEYLIAAVWHVTRDADRFIGVLTESVQKAELSIRFSHPTPWPRLRL